MPALIRNLNLNTSIAAGDPLEYHYVQHAKTLATSLRSLHGEFALLRLTPTHGNLNLFVDSAYEPLVTQEIVAAAMSRAVAVETACKFHVFASGPS